MLISKTLYDKPGKQHEQRLCQFCSTRKARIQNRTESHKVKWTKRNSHIAVENLLKWAAHCLSQKQKKNKTKQNWNEMHNKQQRKQSKKSFESIEITFTIDTAAYKGAAASSSSTWLWPSAKNNAMPCHVMPCTKPA